MTNTNVQNNKQMYVGRILGYRGEVGYRRVGVGYRRELGIYGEGDWGMEG